MELINGEYVMSEKELAKRHELLANTMGNLMTKYLDENLAKVIEIQDDEDADLWDS